MSNLAKGHIAAAHSLLQSSVFTVHVLSPVTVANALVHCGCWAGEQCAVYSSGGYVTTSQHMPSLKFSLQGI